MRRVGGTVQVWGGYEGRVWGMKGCASGVPAGCR